MFISIIRIFKLAAKDFWRNVWLSFVTISILCLAFISLNILLALNLLTNNAIHAVENRIDVSVYLIPEVSDDVIKTVRSYLTSLPGVKEIQVVSADQALALFRERHANNQIIEKSLETIEKNPLGPTLSVKARSPEEYPAIMKALENPTFAQYIAEKNYDDHRVVIERISAVSTKIQRGAMAVSLVFLLIAIMIVFNSVRIAIYSHREEIGIMKLVGASNAFVRMPFMVEGVYYSVFALLLAAAIILPGIRFISPFLVSFFQNSQVDLLVYYQTHWLVIFGLQFVGGVFLTTFAAAIAVGKYLRR